MSSDIGMQPRGEAESGAAVSDQAKEQVQQAAERAQAVVGDAASQAQVKVRDQIGQRSTQVGAQVTATAKALRSTGLQLRTQGNQGAAEAADRAAEQTRRLGSYLESADADQILADVEDFARSNPWAVIVGGVLVGVAAARFLKASSTRRYEATGPRAPAMGTSRPPRAAVMSSPPPAAVLP